MFESFRNRGENKNKTSQHTTTPEQLVIPAHTVDRPLGGVGFRKVEVEPPMEYSQRAREVLAQSEATLLEFAQAAQAEGLSQDQIKQAILAGVETGKLPAIARKTEVLKDGSLTLYALHGNAIPEGAVDVRFSSARAESDQTVQGVSLWIDKAEFPDSVMDALDSGDEDAMPGEDVFYTEPIPVEAGNRSFRYPDYMEQEYLEKLRTAARIE